MSNEVVILIQTLSRVKLTSWILLKRIAKTSSLLTSPPLTHSVIICSDMISAGPRTLQIIPRLLSHHKYFQGEEKMINQSCNLIFPGAVILINSK